MGFKRVLIANRGEIALRILRTLRDMGIEAAIIHGREDRLSLPVQMADIAYPNYRSNPLDSYLDIEAVVQAAKELDCDAVPRTVDRCRGPVIQCEDLPVLQPPCGSCEYGDRVCRRVEDEEFDSAAGCTVCVEACRHYAGVVGDEQVSGP